MAAAAAAPEEIPTYTKFTCLQMAQDSQFCFKNNDELMTLPAYLTLPSVTPWKMAFVNS
jgi:hypothetical protein